MIVRFWRTGHCLGGRSSGIPRLDVVAGLWQRDEENHGWGILKPLVSR